MDRGGGDFLYKRVRVTEIGTCRIFRIHTVLFEIKVDVDQDVALTYLACAA